MHDLDHRNVMSLVGVYFIKSDPCIAMPYMENGSLLAHLKRERHNLIVSERASEKVSFSIWELLNAMSKCCSVVTSTSCSGHEVSFLQEDRTHGPCS